MRKAILVSAGALLGSVCAWAQQPSAPAPAGNGAPAAKAGPAPSAFGLKRGQPVDKLALSPAPEGAGWHILKGKVPQPHPEFETFRLFAAPGVGLCAIRGVGPVLLNDAYGATARERFSRVEAQLTQRYGQGERYDSCDSKTSSCNAGYWSMHIRTGAREFGSMWEDPAKLPAGLKSINLYVYATDYNDPLLVALYTFDNEEQCQASLDAEQSKAL